MTIRLEHILSSIVAPVISDMLAQEEIQEISTARRQGDTGSEILLRIVVQDELFLFYVAIPGQAPESDLELRHRLAEQLQDFIAESGFAWGSRRGHSF